VASVTARAPSVPAPAAPLPVPAPTPTPTPAESPKAAVVHELPEAPSANPLADMAPSARPKDAHRDTLTRALEAPSKERVHAGKAQEKSPHKSEQPKLAQAKAREKPAKEKTAKQRAAKEPDNDVVLLAALMSHMQPRTKKSTVAERLQTCKQYNAAGEEQCRARVCAGADGSERACAHVPAAKAAAGN
jgi:hypothetical protein